MLIKYSVPGIFTNWQGSITAITDDAGAAIGVNAYDAYGIPNDTNIGRFQYSLPEPCAGHMVKRTQMWIPELGLYHYKARAYSPTLGRFLQTDPIRYEDQVNLYAYVGGDPVRNVDPTGLDAVDCDGERPDGDIIYVCGNREKAKCDAECAKRHMEAWDLVQRVRNIQEHASRNANKPQCRKFSDSALGQTAEALDNISDATGAASLGAGALAVASAPTVVGGVGAGTASGVLGIVSIAAKGGSSLASYSDGNATAGQTAAVETAVAVIAGPVLGKIMRVDSPSKAMVQSISQEAHGQGVGALLCP